MTFTTFIFIYTACNRASKQTLLHLYVAARGKSSCPIGLTGLSRRAVVAMGAKFCAPTQSCGCRGEATRRGLKTRAQFSGRFAALIRLLPTKKSLTRLSTLIGKMAFKGYFLDLAGDGAVGPDEAVKLDDGVEFAVLAGAHFPFPCGESLAEACTCVAPVIGRGDEFNLVRGTEQLAVGHEGEAGFEHVGPDREIDPDLQRVQKQREIASRAQQSFNGCGTAHVGRQSGGFEEVAHVCHREAFVECAVTLAAFHGRCHGIAVGQEEVDFVDENRCVSRQFALLVELMQQTVLF